MCLQQSMKPLSFKLLENFGTEGKNVGRQICHIRLLWLMLTVLAGWLVVSVKKYQ